MATHKFDPNEHPRDELGRFTEVLSKMRIGTEAELPDGVRVRAVKSRAGQGRTTRKFKVSQPSADISEAIGNLAAGVSVTSTLHRNAEQAARNALDRSARSRHHRSVGGKQRYKDFADFSRRNSVRAA